MMVAAKCENKKTVEDEIVITNDNMSKIWRMAGSNSYNLRIRWRMGRDQMTREILSQ